MELDNKQIRWLKGKAHHLKPIVTIGGKGLTPQIVSETSAALAHHELIKVKLPALPKQDRTALMTELCAGTSASAVAHANAPAMLTL